MFSILSSLLTTFTGVVASVFASFEEEEEKEEEEKEREDALLILLLE
jgi:hypothetical protein|tara:strand:- start:290 stop:430 length:141 start_codon:yes stop_codon:yes gene_type:complete